MSVDITNKQVQIGDLVIYSRYKRGGVELGIVTRITAKQIQVCQRIYKDTKTGLYTIYPYGTQRVNMFDFMLVDIDSIKHFNTDYLRQVKDFVLGKPVQDILPKTNV